MIRSGTCPRCHLSLAGTEREGAVPLVCPRCKGVHLGGKYLSAHFGPALAALAASKAAEDTDAENLACPIGCATMVPHRLPGLGKRIVVDICPTCEGVWFDGGEVRAVFESHRATQLRRPRRSNSLPAKESSEHTKTAQEELRRVANHQDYDSQGVTGSWLLQFLTGLPIEGFNPVHRAPVVTWGLIVSCCLVYLWQETGGNELLMHYAIVPARLFEGDGVFRRLVASMFMHGGFVHLFGNMYFLKLFGDNVEDRLGRGKFLAIYLACGLVAGLAHALSDVSSVIPALGASGAIGGVLAAYAVFFPDARVQIAPSLLTMFMRFRIRAMFYFPWWFLWQFIAGIVLKGEGVAWWAHIGGFAAGFLVAAVLRNSPDPRLGALAEKAKQLA